jgi:hypothetical protein
MTSFVEKLVAEIVVSLCVGAVLTLISGVSWTPDDAVRPNRRAVGRGCGSNAMIDDEPDQVRACGEHQ